MSDEKKHIVYTAEDIKRYLTGAMPPADMHAMEMAALDDPLLAEAMEGYDLMEQKDWGVELADLRKEFAAQKREQAPVVAITERRRFTWWKTAAAVIVLGTTALTAYLFTNKNNGEKNQPTTALATPVTDSTFIAAADSVKITQGSVAADSTAQLLAKVNGTDAYLNTYTITTTPQNGVTSSWNSATPKAVTDSMFMYKPPNNQPDLAMNDRRNDDRPEEKVAVSNEPAAAPGFSANAIQSNNNFESKKEEESFLNNNAVISNGSYETYKFNGSVVTADNKPLGYANITVPGLKKPVYADANGRFAFTSTDTALKVTVNSAGFSTRKYTLQNTLKDYTLVMEPQDVATAKIGRAKQQFKQTSRAASDSAMIENADEDDTEPSGGWIAYDNYINNNLKLPETARQKNIHGEVEMTVKLKDNGEISTVKVDKPLSPECDAEAIRLVKEGPKWDVKKKKKNKVKVKVTF